MGKFSFNSDHSKTYATEANADKAVAAKGFESFRHFMMKNDKGRFFPIFVGQKALDAGIHFHFHVTF